MVNKRELARTISKRSLLSQKEALQVVDGVFEANTHVFYIYVHVIQRGVLTGYSSSEVRRRKLLVFFD